MTCRVGWNRTVGKEETEEKGRQTIWMPTLRGLAEAMSRGEKGSKLIDYPLTTPSRPLCLPTLHLSISKPM